MAPHYAYLEEMLSTQQERGKCTKYVYQEEYCVWYLNDFVIMHVWHLKAHEQMFKLKSVL
jgi:hypothetical protein